jgi:hypothetical protein
LYNHRDEYNKAIETIRKHARKLGEYYENYHKLQFKRLNDETLLTIDSPIETTIKDIQNVMLKNILDPNAKISEIKKKTNDQIIRSIQLMTEEYDKFISEGLSKINIENRKLLKLNETNPLNITNIILDKNNTKTTVEQRFENLKKQTQSKVYDNIDSLFKIFMIKYGIKRNNVNTAMKPIYITQLSGMVTRINNVLLYATNASFIDGSATPDEYNTLFDSFATSFERIMNRYYFLFTSNENINIKNFYVAFAKKIRFADDNANEKFFQQMSSHNELKKTLTKIIDDIIISGNGAYIKFMSYLFNSDLYFDVPTNSSNDAIIKFYNMMLIGQRELMVRDQPLEMNEPNYNLGQLDPEDVSDVEKVKKINELLPSLIRNLNLWMSLNNLTIKRQFDMTNDNIYEMANCGAFACKQLKLFILRNNGKSGNARGYDNIDVTNNMLITISHPNLIDNNKIDGSIENIDFVPNIFNTESKDADYMNLLKQRFISWFIEKGICYNDVEATMINHFKNLEEMTENDRTLKTTATLVKFLDMLFINTAKNEILLIAVRKIKDTLIKGNDETTKKFTENVVKLLDAVLAKTNVQLKLDKQLNDLVYIQTKSSDKINDMYHIQNIIDEQHITKIFDQTDENKPTEIKQCEQLTEKGDCVDGKENNYLVYQPKDYNNVDITTNQIRKCMFNTTDMIKSIFKNAKSLDYYKLDTNGFMPIFYAIQSSNYMIIKSMFEIIDPKNGEQNSINRIPLLTPINQILGSPIKYAYDLMKETCDTRPDYGILNITFINNLLLSSDIKYNIPTGYYDRYKENVYMFNELLKNHSYNFEGLLNVDNNKYWFDDQIKLPTNKISSNTINYDYGYINNFKDDIEKIELMIHKGKTINDQLKSLNNMKPNMHTKINEIQYIVKILEEKYKVPRLYKYVDHSRPTMLTSSSIKESNAYYHILIATGIMSIKDILQIYFKNLVLKSLYASNLFNFNFKNDNDILSNQLTDVINKFVESNIFDLVKLYYMVKLDQFDNLIQTQNIVESYISRQIDQFVQNGIIGISDQDSNVYSNLKQYVSAHIVELLSKTLDYNNAMLNVFHKWVINVYHSLRTFDELTNL